MIVLQPVQGVLRVYVDELVFLRDCLAVVCSWAGSNWCTFNDCLYIQTAFWRYGSSAAR
jgi:hypothetical protein